LCVSWIVGPDRLFEKHHTVLSDILTVNDVRTASELVFLGDKYMYSCTRNARVKLRTVTATLPRGVGDLPVFEGSFPVTFL
jgi:hypothetical protein